MSFVVWIEDGSETRRLTGTELPLPLGGANPGIEIPGSEGNEPLALFGIADDGMFLQPVADRRRVALNGAPLMTSKSLHDGDVVRVDGDSTEIVRIAVQLDGSEWRLAVIRAPVDDGTEPPIVVADPVASSGDTPPGETIKPVTFTPRLAGNDDHRKTKRHWLSAMLLVPVTALAAIGWFVFTARSVEVRIEPLPDAVVIRGARLTAELDGRYLLRPGRYVVAAEKEGYQALETPFTVTDEAAQTVRFELQRLPGRLLIESVPEAGAEVTIDGVAHGSTPLEPIELAYGKHVLHLHADRYLDAEQQVAITGGGELQRVTVELTPAWAAITFDSKPPGATVRANGDLLGITPLTKDLLAGRYPVEFQLRGYKQRHRALEVVANQPQTVPTVRFEQQDGTVLVSSSPPGAAVSVDEIYRGQAPTKLLLAPGREYRVSASKAGHEDASRDISVAPGQRTELKLVLTPVTGSVEVICSEADATLWVDGAERGVAEGVVQLSTVAHQIEVRKQGFETFKQAVTPRPGTTHLLRVDLIRLAPTPAQSNLLEGPQGQELRLIVAPAKMRMGASRREPGRRSNETLRAVELTRSFYISSTEISNQQFRAFKASHRSGSAGQQSLDGEEQPAVQMSWEDAARYCNWLSEKQSLPAAYVIWGLRVAAVKPMTTGYRMPTEAEWAWVSRYPDGGNKAQKYPWGGSLPVVAGSGNFADSSASAVLPRTIAGYDDGYPVTAPIVSLTANGRGLYHLGGNVAEWVHDLYTIYPSSSRMVRDPLGPTASEYHVIRGASWMDATVTELRLSYRDYGDKPRQDVGFRIARYVE